MNTSSKPKRRYLRFGLLELLLVTGAVATWLPTLMAKHRIPELESKVQLYRSFASELVRVDPNQLCLRRIQRWSSGMEAWKYYLPADADVELRFATEQISKDVPPSQYDSFALPAGEHRIYLREFRDVDEAYVKQVYVDDAIVLTSKHPKSWLESGGSSYSNLSMQSEAYPLTEPLELRNARYTDRKQIGSRTIYARVPDEYDTKGCSLWIAPADLVAKPAPNFISPNTPGIWNRWGLRQGIQIGDLNSADSPGLIGVIAGFDATEGDTRSASSIANRLSIRPLVASSSDPDAEIEKAELPELQPSYVNAGPGLRIGLSQSVDVKPKERFSLGLVSQDGKTMRIFCHYENESAGFANGAKPVIETIFDVDRPNQIGLLPHQAAGSKPIKAIQIVTTMDARYRRRRMELAIDGSDVETVPLPKQAVQELSGKSGTDFEADDQPKELWQTVSLKRVPLDRSTQMRKLKFSTDVKDFFKAKLPATFDPEWAYEGINNCQTWWLPLPDAANPASQDYKVEILQTVELPSSKTPTTMLPIPGGPVIKSVRITVPMPATKPIWLEITPDP